MTSMADKGSIPCWEKWALRVEGGLKGKPQRFGVEAFFFFSFFSFSIFLNLPYSTRLLLQKKPVCRPKPPPPPPRDQEKGGLAVNFSFFVCQNNLTKPDFGSKFPKFFFKTRVQASKPPYFLSNLPQPKNPLMRFPGGMTLSSPPSSP